MNINDLEEKKLIFGPMQYIYWTPEINNTLYTITAFNTGTLMFHVADNEGLDAVLFPTLTNTDLTTTKTLMEYVIELMKDSASRYNGSRDFFTGYFLLQPYIGDYVDEMLSLSSKGIDIEYIGLTKTAGITFHKFQITIEKKAL